MVLSVAGVINAGYLIWKHQQKKPMVCPLDHDCSKVTEGKWSRIFFVRNEVLGTLFFVSMFLASLSLIIFPNFNQNLFLFILIATSGGLLFSLALILIQIYLIKDYCFYCLISAGITLLLFFNSILLFVGFN